MTKPKRKSHRQRGSIEERGRDRWRVRVYAGKDAVTGKDLYLTETCTSYAAADRKRIEFLSQVDDGRAAQTNATFNLVLDRYFQAQQPELVSKTLDNYRGYADDYIRPVVGDMRMPELKRRLVAIAEQLYADLAVCKRRCKQRLGLVDHRNPRRTGRQLVTDLTGHICNRRCRPHQCEPLSPLTIRQVHTIISGACAAAERWGWLSPNPANQIRQPKRGHPKPNPPTAKQAAALVGEAFNQNVEWGTIVWLLMMTGNRRGELVETQLSDINFDRHLIRVNPTKTETNRWISLDELTIGLLAEHRDRIAEKRATLGLPLTGEEYIYSYRPDHAKPGSRDWFTHRYGAMAKKLGFHSTPHKMRHFSATELIAAGIDLRTVAGRLGHLSGGMTTMNTYAAWLPGADQQAVQVLAERMPALPQVRAAKIDRDRSAEQSRRTDPELEQRICAIRRNTGMGPNRIKKHLAAEGISIAESTVWLVLKRHGLTGASG